VPNYFAVENNI